MHTPYNRQANENRHSLLLSLQVTLLRCSCNISFKFMCHGVQPLKSIPTVINSSSQMWEVLERFFLVAFGVIYCSQSTAATELLVAWPEKCFKPDILYSRCNRAQFPGNQATGPEKKTNLWADLYTLIHVCSSCPPLHSSADDRQPQQMQRRWLYVWGNWA